MKESIENKLNPAELQRTRVIGDIDSINTQVLLVDGEPIMIS